MPPSDSDVDLELTDAGAAPRPGRGATVFVRSAVLGEVQAHAAEDLNTELGGVLVGTAAAAAEGTLVFVEASIRALHTDAARGSVTFTHDTWEQINRIKDRDHPDKRIVGWYHTHPGFGLFLSNYDQFIHRNFFSLPWQVAWVVDPRAQESGVFVWKDGELSGPQELEVVGGEAAPAPVAALPAATPVRRQASLRRWRAVLVGTTMLSIAALGYMGGLLRMQGRVRGAQDMTEQALNLARQAVGIAEQSQGMNKQFGKAVGDALKATGPQAKVSPSAPPRAPAKGPGPAAGPTTYTVKRGDSLWRIAKHYYGNGEKWGAIAIANGIEADDLEPGMRLVIPMPAKSKD